MGPDAQQVGLLRAADAEQHQANNLARSSRGPNLAQECANRTCPPRAESIPQMGYAAPREIKHNLLAL
jgi:hypothetical protein